MQEEDWVGVGIALATHARQPGTAYAQPRQLLVPAEKKKVAAQRQVLLTASNVKLRLVLQVLQTGAGVKSQLLQ